ncbi:hypothetical protein Tco_0642573 [Tanacetum coccineum]
MLTDLNECKRISGNFMNSVRIFANLDNVLLGYQVILSAKHHLVVKGLSECKASESNVRRIQVKDTIKEVKDYLKAYSSVGMDNS